MFSGGVSTTNQSRLKVLAFLLTFGFAVITGQLVRRQVGDHKQLELKAIEQCTKKSVISAQRGTIVDRNRNLLALDTYRWDISVSPSLVEKADEVADRLADSLKLPRDQVYATLTSDVSWVMLKRNVDQEVGEAILALDAAGVTCDPRPWRIHPEGDLFAHFIGIVSESGDGYYGVEGYDDWLIKGVRGDKVAEHSPWGDELPLKAISITPAQPGASLVLTVDRNIQYIAYEELQAALERYGAESGTVVIMDPKTGELLASVSLPTYDPDDFAGADLPLLLDPVVSSMWEPGSIFKVVTWGIGLDTGTISPWTAIYDSGQREVGGRVIMNWDRQGYGDVTMTDGLVKSLNTVAAFISTSTGKELFYTYLRRFGFGQLTEVDLANEGPGLMKLPGDSDWFPSELGTNSFGQGIAVTPIQMISAVASVANRGMLMKPYVVRQVITQDENGHERVVQVEPMSVRLTISPETAETLTDMMVQVVEEGATDARIPGYHVAGKTGTAQIPTPYGYDPNDTIASFVGFAPADDPQFIVLIKLDRPTASPWGSRTAAPTFKAIAERLFVYMQIPPDEIRLAQGP